MKLLPGSLRTLGQSLCPELGAKGEVVHTSVHLDNLSSRKAEFLDYMKQEIYLLGGIMKKAQDIYWDLYEIDITRKITLSSLALTIFRKHFSDDVKTPIAIPKSRRVYSWGMRDTLMFISLGERPFIIMMLTQQRALML